MSVEAGPLLVAEAGGTSLRAAVFDPVQNALTGRREVETPVIAAGESVVSHRGRVLAALAELGDGALGGRSPAGVGIAYPGPMTPTGLVLATPTLSRRATGDGAFDLAAECRLVWPDTPVRLVNDLTAAGSAYVADGRRDFAVLTVGSGIGHKVFLDGRPRTGAGRGGEIGHLRVDYADDAEPCDCGGRGHLGAVASGRGTVATLRRLALTDPALRGRSRYARMDLVDVDGHALAEGFLAGDPLAQAAVARGAGFLGHGLAAIHLDTGVEDIVLIGGFAHGLGESYRRLLVEAAAASCWDIGQEWDTIIRLGPAARDAALLGLGLLLTSA